MQVNRFLERQVVILFMMGVTVYSLFFDDLRVLVTPKSADDYFFGVSSFAFVTFGVEIIL